MDSIVDPKTSTVTITVGNEYVANVDAGVLLNCDDSWVEDYPHVGGTKRQSMDWSTTADESSTSRELE